MNDLAPELIHLIALSGHLSFSDVSSLALTSTRLASILTHDTYANAIHHALRGLTANMAAKNWTSARYALSRGWYADERDDVDETNVWKLVVEVVGSGVVSLQREEVGEWEKILFKALSLPRANVSFDSWMTPGGNPDEGEVQNSLLHIAVFVGSQRLVAWVVERGGNLEIGAGSDVTPLWFAAYSGRLELVKVLVEAGADVGARNQGDKSLLHAASACGHAPVVHYLLGLGTQEVDDVGGFKTPLSMACEAGALDVVKLLVEMGGADVDRAGHDYENPLFLACQTGLPEVVDFLLAAGALEDAERDGFAWERALFAAVAGGHVEIVRSLLAAGADGNVTSAGGESPLLIATDCGLPEIARLLIEEGGADANQTNDTIGGNTALHVACEVGDLDLVSLLLAAGADISAQAEDGATPLQLAKEGGHDAVLRLLETPHEQ